MKAKTLSVKNLTALFGVTAMTVYNWRKGLTAGKAKMPDALTPAAVRRWAEQNGVDMSCDPASLLGTGAEKPGPKPKLGEGLASLSAYSEVPPKKEPSPKARHAKAGPKALLHRASAPRSTRTPRARPA